MKKGKKNYKFIVLVLVIFTICLMTFNFKNITTESMQIFDKIKNVANMQSNDEQENQILNIELKVKDKQKDGITLSWEEFKEADTYQITSYKLYKDNEYVGTINEKEYNFKGLESDKEYNFSVEFINSSDEVVVKKEISNIHTAKVIQRFMGDIVYPKDTYYIQTDFVFANSNTKFEAGCVLKFEKNGFTGSQGNSFEIESSESDRTIIASAKYDGNYDESNEEFLLNSILVKDNNLENVDFLCKNVWLRPSSDSEGNIIIRNCNFVGNASTETYNKSQSKIIFENNKICGGKIAPHYSNDISIANNNIKGGNLELYLYDDSKCNIKDNYGVNDDGAILKLNLKTITSAQNLENMLGTNKNNSTSEKAIDIEINGFPVSEGTLNLPKANYLFCQTAYENLDCNVSVEAGSQVNILNNIDFNIAKKLEFNGTSEDDINIYCYNKKYSTNKTEKWGSFVVGANGELVGKYVKIHDSGKTTASQTSSRYGFVSSAGKLSLDNIEVIDNNNVINITGSSASITNSKLVGGINCNLKDENTVDTNKFICTNNEFSEGKNIVYAPVDGAISEIKNNRFNVDSEYLNLSLNKCSTTTLENVLSNISGNVNEKETKYNIAIENIPENENIHLNVDKYLFKFQDLKSNMQVDKGSYIYIPHAKGISIYNELKLNGTSDEKIHIENEKEDGKWDRIRVMQSGRLEAENVFIKKRW